MAVKMRVLILLFFASCVSAKINMKPLTESMGQEVVEIGAPIKELPPDIEEEPSAENEGTTTEFKKVLKKSDLAKKTKDVDKNYRKKQEEEEERIEKELSDIYKDSIDYKSETTVVTHEENTTEVSRPIERARTDFQFQPDSNRADDVEKFRTSVDEISCEKKKLSGKKSDSLIKRTKDEVIRIKREPGQDEDDLNYERASANVTEIIENNKVKLKMDKRKSTKTGYWFGPNSTNPRDIARFRTSQDDFGCGRVKLTSYKPSILKSRSKELFEDMTFLNLILFLLNFIYLT